MTKTKRSKRNEPNDQNETTKKVYKKKITVINNKMNALRCQMSVVIFFLFRLWSTPDLPHREIQLSLDCHWLSIRRRGNLNQRKKTVNKRVTDIDVVNEYRNLFLSLLSVYASVFNEAGVPFWKLHISVKLKFQLLAWWKKLSFVRRP